MDEKLINTNQEANKAKETAISPDVAFSNQTPVKLPNKPKQNPTLSFEPFIASAQANIEQATKTRDEGMANIKQISDLLGNQANRQIEMEEQSGVKTLREDVTRLDSLISSKTQQYRTELQNLEGQNIASSFISGQQNRLNVLATRELANLSIIRDSQSGRLEDAQAWVKAKVDAETAQLKSKLEFQQFVYGENKEILNKEQDKKFQLQIKQTEQAYADEKAKREKIEGLTIEAARANAPASALDAISNSESFGEAINTAGKYLGAEFRMNMALKTQQLSNMRLDAAAKSQQIQAAKQAAVASASKNIDQKTVKEIVNSKNGESAISLMKVDAVIKEYQNMIKKDLNPGRVGRANLNSFLNNVVAPSLAVANGQGALQKDEMDRMIKDLGVSALKRETRTINNAETIRKGIQSKLDVSTAAIETIYPGATKEIGLFNDYNEVKKNEQYGDVKQRVNTLAGMSPDKLNTAKNTAKALGVSTSDLLSDNEIYEQLINY